LKRIIVRIDDVLDILRYNSGKRFSVREMQKKLGYGDWRTISVFMKALVAYKGIKVDRIYGHIVYYYPKKKKR
jgi:hypothetical protein